MRQDLTGPQRRAPRKRPVVAPVRPQPSRASRAVFGAPEKATFQQGRRQVAARSRRAQKALAKVEAPRVQPRLTRQTRGVFGAPGAATFQQGRQAASARSERAREKLPARPVPYVPLLEHATRAQRQAAQKIVQRSFEGQLPPGAGLGERRRVSSELARDPRTALPIAIGRYYAGQDRGNATLDAARLRGEQLGVPNRYAGEQVSAGLRDFPVPVKARPHKADTRVGPGAASINLTSLSRGVSNQINREGGVAAVHFLGRDVFPFLGRAGSDVLNLPFGAIKSTYELGKAIGEIPATTKPLRNIAEGMSHGAVGSLLIHGDPAASARAISQHPVLSGLEISGAYGAVGRTAGAVARSGLLRDAGRVAGATARADAYVPGTTTRVPQSYSKNIVTATLQRRSEAGARRSGVDPNALTGYRATRAIHRTADEFASREQQLGRSVREDVRRQVEALQPTRSGASASTRAGRRAIKLDQRRARARAAAAAQSPWKAVGRWEDRLVEAAAERLVHPRTARQDVTREMNRLNQEYADHRQEWGAGQRRQNRAQAHAYAQALRDPEFDARMAGVFQNAEHAVKASHRTTAALIKLGALDPQQAKAAAARPYAVGVMGARYDPRLAPSEAGAAAYDAAKAQSKAAKQDLRAAKKVAQQARDARVALAKKQQVQAGQQVGARILKTATSGKRANNVLNFIDSVLKEGDSPAVSRAARIQAGRAKAMAAVRLVERQANSRVKAAEEAARQAKESQRRAQPKKYATGLTLNGERLSTADVYAHMHANGVKAPGFFSHRADTKGAKAYFQNWLNGRSAADRFHRTGKSTQIGGHDQSMQGVMDSLVQGAGLVQRMKSWDSFIREFGAKKSDGGLMTWEQATKIADEINAHADAFGGPKLVPVRAIPAKYSRATQNEIEQMQGAGRLPKLAQSMSIHIAHALEQPAPGDTSAQNVVLVPHEAIERFKAHQNLGSGPVMQGMGKLTGAFRTTVLPFSVKWLVGNVAEATLRSAIHGITPRDAFLGRRILANLEAKDAEAARSLRENAATGLLYGSRDRLSVRRDGVTQGTFMEPVGAAAGAVGATRTVTALRHGLGLYVDGVFKLNKAIEREFQHAAIGRAARHQAQEFGNSWIKSLRLQGKALDDVVNGLTDTKNQAAFARSVDEVLGKYSRFSPAMRRTVQAAAPFLPWYLNSFRFVLHTLPVKHPVKTGVLASVEMALQNDLDEAKKKLPPGDLGAAIQLKDGGLLPLARYTPFGAWTAFQESGLIGGLTDPILPQFSSAYGIAKYGKDFTGRDLQLSTKQPATGHDRTMLALYSMLESFLPGVALARRLQEHGQTSYADSTVWAPKSKPGTSYGSSAVNRVFNPFRPTYLQAPTSGGGALRLSSEPAGPVDPVRKALQQAAQARSGAGADPAVLQALRDAQRGR